jgi:hypothetical protein
MEMEGLLDTPLAPKGISEWLSLSLMRQVWRMLSAKNRFG